uniref:EOG090X0HTT n=1 Tax=Daphnia similis TaxID=35528 RepID=A0A4Y7N5N3_9CRUS|nr:EOG090X0HTT [Daphnia similis]SVE87114.1 EOG090X0HTT [Daphnia similis]SVE88370.1 EOG090X0HTT [Daphnia similis]
MKIIKINEIAQYHGILFFLDSGPYSAEIAVVREIYDGENAQERFELELERALEAAVPVIVIEPVRLGDETARWIAVGNCLHKTAVLAGLGSVITGLFCDNRPYIYTPLGLLSLLCTGLYTASWQFDPCCKYQVEMDTKRLAKLPVNRLTTSSPIVLVRRDDNKRKTLHCTICVTAASITLWKLYFIAFK